MLHLIICIFRLANAGYWVADEADYISNFQNLIKDSYQNPRPEGLSSCVNQADIPNAPTSVSVTSSTISSADLQALCGTDKICVIPEGSTLQMDGNLDVAALVIRGELFWHSTTQSSNDQWLCAGYIAVEDSGRFKLDVTEKKKRAFIYLKNNGATHEILRTRGFGGVPNKANPEKKPTIEITGSPMARTWSLLAREVKEDEDMTIMLMHDPKAMGWSLGDRIVIAPSVANSEGTAGRYFIKGFQANNQLELATDEALSTIAKADQNFRAESRYASNAHIAQMNMEVINLRRNVIITGDDFKHVACRRDVTEENGCKCDDNIKRTQCTAGLHTAMMGPGEIKIQYTRVEKCGQRGIKGKYCFHMHLMGGCPTCLFKGNAVEYSHQRGLVIHGTHLSTVEENVFSDVRGANMYIEDGGELYNVIKYNVAICPWNLGKFNSNRVKRGCTVPGTDNDQADTEVNQAGIWALSSTNHLTGNRYSNHFNGMFYQVTMRNGRASTQGEVCPRSHPVGRMVGNTFHGGGRFGTYFLSDNFPKKNLGQTVQSDGHIPFLLANNRNDPLDPCYGFLENGETHGDATALLYNLDYDNAFVGQYDAGDFQYLHHISVNNNNMIYWKTTKNFEDGCSSHLFKSYYDGNGGQMAMPGGHGAFLIEQTVFKNNIVLEPNHHCNSGTTGVMCADSVYVFIDSTWDVTRSSNWVYYQKAANNYGGIITMGPDDEAQPNNFFPKNSGYMSTVSHVHTWLLALGGGATCTKASDLGLEQRYDNGILCKKPMRRLTIYTRGLTPATKGAPLTVDVFEGGNKVTTAIVEWFMIGQDISFNTRKQGYAMPVIPGTDIEYRVSLSGGNIPADWVIEFSDPVFANRWPGKSSNKLRLVVQGRTCPGSPDYTTAQHDRRFIYADSVDHLPEQAWGHGACTEHPDMPTINCKNIPALKPQSCDEKCSGGCTNGFCECGSGTCMCNPGFTGLNCAVDVCAKSRCGLHGRCSSRFLGGDMPVTQAACVCEPPWAGPLCDSNPCETQDCSGHGTCLGINDGSDYLCDCDEGWTGRDCERDACTTICPAYGTNSKFKPPTSERRLREKGVQGWCAIKFEYRWDEKPRDLSTPDNSEDYCCYGNCHVCGSITCPPAPNDCHKAGRCKDGVCTEATSRPDGTNCNSQPLGTCQNGVCIGDTGTAETNPPTLSPPTPSPTPTPAKPILYSTEFKPYPGYTDSLAVVGSITAAWTTFETTNVNIDYFLDGVEALCQERDDDQRDDDCSSDSVVWNTIASDGQGGDYSCGSRITYLQGEPEKKSLTEAKNQVADEFPAVCGACKADDDGEQAVNSCGMHILSGTSCDNAGEPYFEGDANPWSSVAYSVEASTSSDGFGQRSGASTSCKYGEALLKNTYTNRGSINIDESPVAMPLAQCLVRCSDDPECSCVVVDPCDSIDCACWKRKQCVEADMEDSTTFEVYIKDPNTCQSDNSAADLSGVSSAAGEIKVSLGYSFQDTIDHPLVIYNYNGEPVACTLLVKGSPPRINSVLSHTPGFIFLLSLLVTTLYP